MSKQPSSNQSQRSSSQVYHLTSAHAGRTVAAVLKDFNGEQSWGRIKKWVAGRFVQVNGNLCLDEARRLNEGDVVKLLANPTAKPVEYTDIRIAHLDDALVVVEKPAGVTSVRHVAERKFSTRRRQLQPTLDELLPQVLARVQRLRWPPLPPKGMNRGRKSNNLLNSGPRAAGIQNAKRLPPDLQVFPVHRLDRDTSGLMLFARTRQAEQRLVAMFKKHTIKREYVAFCHGQVEAQSIRSWMIRDRGDGVRGSVEIDGNDSKPEGALEAITHVVTSEVVVDAPQCISQIRCRLETGRTHQIRIHLSAANHPLCGDKIYGHSTGPSSAKQKAVDTEVGVPRQALHSDLLEFEHPISGKPLKFRMSLPKDLQQWLKRLKSSKAS